MLKFIYRGKLHIDASSSSWETIRSLDEFFFTPKFGEDVGDPSFIIGYEDAPYVSPFIAAEEKSIFRLMSPGCLKPRALTKNPLLFEANLAEWLHADIKDDKLRLCSFDMAVASNPEAKSFSRYGFRVFPITFKQDDLIILTNMTKARAFFRIAFDNTGSIDEAVKVLQQIYVGVFRRTLVIDLKDLEDWLKLKATNTPEAKTSSLKFEEHFCNADGETRYLTP